MAAAKLLLNEDHLMCPICLEVFTDPVTTPCGHNFCKNCITAHWDQNGGCQCPLCKKIFSTRPELQVNFFIAEMAAQFRSSISETDQKPQLTASGLEKHQSADPGKATENMMCKNHDKPLELYCEKDNTCVCMLCIVLNHKGHSFISLKEAYKKKRLDLHNTVAKVQKMIQEKQLKIQVIEHSLELSDEDAEREKASGLQIVNIINTFLEKRLREITDVIEDKQRLAQEKGQGFITELQQEVSELERRSAELEKLSGCNDGPNFLQTFSSLKKRYPQKDWSNVRIPPPVYEGTVRKVVELEFQDLDKTEGLNEELKKLADSELRKFRQYAVNVTLNPSTAAYYLDLSDDKKQVWGLEYSASGPNNPERFSYWGNVLGNHGYSSGRFYFEVQVSGKTEWYVGVARQSVDRHAQSPMSPENGYWIVWLRNNEYQASSDPSVLLSPSQLERVGVFVDYEEGQVVFYNTEPVEHLYTFSGCSFNDTLFPMLNPLTYDSGNADPLIIVDV